jgi:hypothetical protein
MLEEYSKDHPYPFYREGEERAFSYLFRIWPMVNYIAGLKKAFAYWEEHPKALKRNPREQLKEEFLWKEIEAYWKKELVSTVIEQESNKG